MKKIYVISLVLIITALIAGCVNPPRPINEMNTSLERNITPYSKDVTPQPTVRQNIRGENITNQSVSRYLSDPIVMESKQLIMKYGFSESYFDRHFSLVEFINFTIPNGALVAWKFKIGDYEATVRDSVGYYVSGTGVKYIHSIAPAQNLALPVFKDFEDVIPESKADSLMKSCIGDFVNARAELRLLGPESGFFYVAEPENNPTVCGPPGSMAPCKIRTGVVDLQTGQIIQCD